MNNKEEKVVKYDRITIIVGCFVVSIILAINLIAPQQFIDGLDRITSYFLNHFGFVIITLVVVIVIFSIWLSLSKYGSIRLGKAKPEYSTFSWFAMIFCTGMGTSIVFWSAVEWANYVVGSHPFGLDYSGTMNIALAYSFFHWGIAPWAVYVVGAIPIAYRYYVRKKEGMSIQTGCSGVIGEKQDNIWGTIINIIFVVGTMGSICLSYGTGIPMMTDLMNKAFGVPQGVLLNVIFLVVLTTISTGSSLSGLDKGIKFFSSLCLYILYAMVIYIFFVGYPLFSIENTIQSFGLHLVEFPKMLTYLDPVRTSGGFPQNWTTFYWSWWIGLAPFLWIFIAKCSKGRTVKSVILTIISAGTLSAVIFFGVISNYGMGKILFSHFNWATLGSNGTFLDRFYTTGNNFTLISDIVSTMPFAKVVMVAWILGCFFLLVTTLDSTSYTLSAACIKSLHGDEDSPKKLRFFWSIILVTMPCILFVTQAPFDSFTHLMVLSAVPVSIIVVMCMISCYKWMKADFGHMTKDQIVEFFMLDEERLLLEEQRKEAEIRFEEKEDE